MATYLGLDSIGGSIDGWVASVDEAGRVPELATISPQTVDLDDYAAALDSHTGLVDSGWLAYRADSGIVGTLATSAALSGGRQLFAASIAGSASASATLTTGIRLAASVAGAAQTGAGLATAIRLAASISGTLGTAAPLTTGIRLAASLAGTAQTGAGLATAIRLAASISGTLGTAAPLTTGIQLAGSASSALASTGALRTGVGMPATATGALAASAGLTTGIELASFPLLDAVATPSDDWEPIDTLAPRLWLAAGGSLQLAVQLAASGNGTLSTSAALRTGVGMPATATGALAASAGLTTGTRLAGGVAATVGTAAALRTGVRFAGASTLAAQATGELFEPVTLFDVRDYLASLANTRREAEYHPETLVTLE